MTHGPDPYTDYEERARRRYRRRLMFGTLALALLIVAAAAFIVGAGSAKANPPDVSFPYCPGGGVATAWGGYCDGKTFPDGTKWHTDAYWAPFVGRVWNPIVCVVANAPAPPPLAPPGGCGGGY